MSIQLQTDKSSSLEPKITSKQLKMSIQQIKRKSRLDSMYKQLIAENRSKEPRPFIVPQRRVCSFGPMATEYHYKLAKETTYIRDDEILKVHPIRFLRESPFVQFLDLGGDDLEIGSMKPEKYEKYLKLFETSLQEIDKAVHAIGVTERGEHVLLQQAVKSCVPTCIGMLLLDRGKTPNYGAIVNTHLSKIEESISWVKEAGLRPIVTELSESSAVETLKQCLQTEGPGMLSVSNETIGYHVIILDAIEGDTARIREPFHGWSLTIKLDALIPQIGAKFVQICRSEKPSGLNSSSRTLGPADATQVPKDAVLLGQTRAVLIKDNQEALLLKTTKKP